MHSIQSCWQGVFSFLFNKDCFCSWKGFPWCKREPHFSPWLLFTPFHGSMFGFTTTPFIWYQQYCAGSNQRHLAWTARKTQLRYKSSVVHIFSTLHITLQMCAIHLFECVRYTTLHKIIIYPTPDNIAHFCTHTDTITPTAELLRWDTSKVGWSNISCWETSVDL